MEYPKYLLSLERAVDRRSSSIAEMDKMFGHGNYELIDGVDCWKLRDYTDYDGEHFADPKVIQRVESELGITMDAIIDQEVLEKDFWLINNPGTVACTIGHGIILKKFLATNAPVAFIAEDDILFQDQTTIEELDLIASHVMSDEDPVMALTYHHQLKTVYLLKETKVELLTTAMYNPKNPRFVWSTVGYFINRKAAQNILDNMFPISFVIDWFSVYIKNGWIKKLWCTYPFLTRISGAKSLSFCSSAAHYEGFFAPVKMAVHNFAQFCIDYNVPAAGYLFQKRRERLYPFARNNNTELV